MLNAIGIVPSRKITNLEIHQVTIHEIFNEF